MDEINHQEESTSLMQSEVVEFERTEDNILLGEKKPSENTREKNMMLIALLVCSFVA